MEKDLYPVYSFDQESWEEEFQKFVETLPRERMWYGDLYQYQGFWYPPSVVKPMISVQQQFRALDSDVIVASVPKSGTTWLKALTFSLLNRSRYTSTPFKDSPFQTTTPHHLVPSLESVLYRKSPSPDLSHLPSPRAFSTHIPYPSLPPSIKDSNCRILYVCRNPLDLFISRWHLLHKLVVENRKPISLDKDFEDFCRGIHSIGPLADHVLGYWKTSLERPEKVLFLKYEEMKQDIYSQAKRLADFLGCPFSAEEEKLGVVREICGLCSFGSMKNLEVNNSGKHPLGIPNSAFYRKGKVGDWEDHLSPSQAEYLENLIEEKLRGSGLTLKVSAGSRKEDDQCCKPSPDMDA